MPQPTLLTGKAGSTRSARASSPAAASSPVVISRGVAPQSRSDLIPAHPTAHKVTVRIARAFDGPRHRRLEAIWDTIAEYARDRIVLRWEPNTRDRVSHADIFNRMWRKDRRGPNRYVLLTESDFLPDLNGHWLPLTELTYFDADALGVPYLTRNPSTLTLRVYETRVGGWWVLIDKSRAPASLDFDGDPDPCNQLGEQMKVRFARPTCDARPRHYGVRYPDLGDHLFWSRHYHDNPERTIAGVNLGDMQHRVDQAITAWIWRQPKRFTDLLRKRAPEAFRA